MDGCDIFLRFICNPFERSLTGNPQKGVNLFLGVVLWGAEALHEGKHEADCGEGESCKDGESKDCC